MRFSVVIPTYNRRELVLLAVAALAGQVFERGFEVIVVVDGSSDGSAAALRELDTPFPLVTLKQENLGAAAARNRGAKEARGEILLFLDDDMEADARLLAEHDAALREGTEVVLGDMPLHPDSPRNIVSAGVEHWAEGRRQRLSRVESELTLHDLLTGQLSIRRDLFRQLGGFDEAFTADGAFGGEDIDFGLRLLRDRHRIVFNPRAITHQRYVVSPRQHLRQWRGVGRADFVLTRKYPEQAETILSLARANRRLNRWLWKPLAAMPLVSRVAFAAARGIAAAAASTGSQSRPVGWLFFGAQSGEYVRGMHEAERRQGRVRVLAYHAVSDLSNDGMLSPYGVPAKRLRAQLLLLGRCGFQFLDASTFVRALEAGARFPPRAVMLTFDDCFADLLTEGLPILRELGVPAAAFAVSQRVGGTNSWDEAIGACQRPLLSAEGLRALSAAGVEIGAHSRTHPSLPRLSTEELELEVWGSADELERAGLPRPRLFAYPYGEHDARVREAVRRAGVKAGFTVKPGTVRGATDQMALPRIEISRSDHGLRFLAKLVLADRPRLLRRGIRSVAGPAAAGRRAVSNRFIGSVYGDVMNL